MNKFWEIDNYMLYEETVTCNTEIDQIQSLGILDPDNNNPHHTIPKNTTVKLHLWAALTLQSSGAVKINEPPYLSSQFYNQLLTAPTIINFKNKNNYFYEIALVLIPNLFDIVYEWTSLIWKSLVARFLHLYNNSKSVIYENYDLIKNLCLKEKDFYLKIVEINEKTRNFMKEYNKVNKEADIINKRNSLVNRKK